jgi:hypothetical protein
VNHYSQDEESRDLSVIKREICAACGEPEVPNENSDQGPLCRHCKDSATEVRMAWVIRGRTFTKDLKRLRSVPRPEKVDIGGADRQE